ncbi:hypothetical protein LCGC14_1019300 [marine sediment metagenome]|uniref:Uncharacterized protein n=1 Tax=marine sediment metagenome TaxID=412755 RepID=A0A0F9MXV3_9ZZZZ
MANIHEIETRLEELEEAHDSEIYDIKQRLEKLELSLQLHRSTSGDESLALSNRLAYIHEREAFASALLER